MHGAGPMQQKAHKQGRKRRRTLKRQDDDGSELHQEPENEYERQREERMARNAAVLEQLKVKQMVEELSKTMRPLPVERAAPSKSSKSRVTKLAAPAPSLPARRSGRQRGLQPVSDGGNEIPVEAKAEPVEDELMSCEDYFKWREIHVEPQVIAEGYTGWVHPEVSEQCGIATSADAAWEQGGGGSFSFKIDKKAIPSHLKGRGWSDAKAFSSTQLQKNPNAYFYRHVAPGEKQANGEWTAEEHELFMDTARKYGAGDKWGLFSSYIPQRVGYQCSAYYKDEVLPQGLIFDSRFRISRAGKAVFVG